MKKITSIQIAWTITFAIACCVGYACVEYWPWVPLGIVVVIALIILIGHKGERIFGK